MGGPAIGAGRGGRDEALHAGCAGKFAPAHQGRMHHARGEDVGCVARDARTGVPGRQGLNMVIRKHVDTMNREIVKPQDRIDWEL